MKHTLTIALLILSGCTTPPKPAVLLPAGTKIITERASDVRRTFRNSTDYWRSGSVVELKEPLVLTTIEGKGR